jgi:hypothetical protein
VRRRRGEKQPRHLAPRKQRARIAHISGILNKTCRSGWQRADTNTWMHQTDAHQNQGDRRISAQKIYPGLTRQ